MSIHPVICPLLGTLCPPVPTSISCFPFQRALGAVDTTRVSIEIMSPQQRRDYDSGFVKIESDTNAAVLSLAWSAEKTDPLKAAAWEVSFCN